ncbi:MAG: tail fiber domain-containing protein [candidate division Zixibacteria bacterium]|nr:tail fiber domain-containing protein [candidate division Zixibacteria bacterium]
MRGIKYSKALLICLVVVLLLVSTASAVDSLLINYQGHLSGSDGTPVTQDIQMTFTIYDNGGVSYWTETHSSVVVTNGMFNVILGSQAMLESAVFSNPELYLGINVGTTREEILPRTLLTSVPGAARADKVQGDLVTEPGIMELHPPDPCVPPDPCSTYPAIVLSADEVNTKLQLHPPEPCVPPEPCDPLGPAFELVADGELNELIVFSPPPDDNRPSIKLKANNENKIDLYYPDVEADEGVVQIGASADKGAFLEVHSSYPPTLTRVMMGGSTTDTGFVRLMGGPDEMEYKLLELNSHTNTGGSIKFFDPENIDGRELLTINCSPPTTRSENGWGIYGFNPQPEPPGIPALEIGMDFDGPASENYFRLNNPLSEYLDEPLMEMTTNQMHGAQFKIFDLSPAAGDGSRELLSMGNNGPSDGIGIYGFNPQPEPPGLIGFEIETLAGTRGPGGGRIAVYDTEDASVELSGGLMQVGHKDDANYPIGSMEVTSVTSQLTLVAESSAGDPPVITMFAGPDGAKVGIGTNSLTEALCVIGNIGLTGDLVTLTDTKLKSNIQPIDNALETIEALNGVSYDWRQDADSKLRLTDRRQIGLLAHEVEAVLPELVHHDADGNRMVAYTKLTAVLIEAIKELKAENESLKSRLEIIEKGLK